MAIIDQPPGAWAGADPRYRHPDVRVVGAGPAGPAPASSGTPRR